MPLIEFKYTPPSGLLGDIAKDPSKAKDVVMGELVKSETLTGQTVEGFINEGTPVKTGTLLAGNTSSIVQEDSAVVVTWQNLVEYAPYVEEGTSRMTGRFMFQQGLAKAQSDIDKLANQTAQNIADKLNG